MFELTGVSKRYDGVPVLQDITLRVSRGETVILLGPSGCGKSTTLRLMLGLIFPDEGTVAFDGGPLSRARLPEIRRRIGYVIQDGGLFPHLTGEGNVTLVARQLRWDRARIARRLDELLALTRLPEAALSRYPLELSGGQRQRLALMRALMLDPDALLLDEPLAALDPMVRRDLQIDLRRVFLELGKSTVLVTHDLAEAAWFGDRVVLFREGRIVQRGSIREMAERPAERFVTEFLDAQTPHFAPASGPSGSGR